MTEAEELAILNQAFVRTYRSYGQYLREAAPVFDVGQETIEAILDRQAADAERLGAFIVQRQGNLYPGFYPTELGDPHFLNSSFVLHDWIAAQEKLVSALEGDLARVEGAEGEGIAILTEIVQHKKEHLARLRELVTIPVPVVT